MQYKWLDRFYIHSMDQYYTGPSYELSNLEMSLVLPKSMLPNIGDIDAIYIISVSDNEIITLWKLKYEFCNNKRYNDHIKDDPAYDDAIQLQDRKNYYKKFMKVIKNNNIKL